MLAQVSSAFLFFAALTGAVLRAQGRITP